MRPRLPRIAALHKGKPAGTSPAGLPSRDRLFAQRPEACANLLRQELRLLEGGKVPTLWQLVVVDQLGVRPLGPASRSRIEFIREDAHGNRELDALGS